MYFYEKSVGGEELLEPPLPLPPHTPNDPVMNAFLEENVTILFSNVLYIFTKHQLDCIMY